MKIYEKINSNDKATKIVRLLGLSFVDICAKPDGEIAYYFFKLVKIKSSPKYRAVYFCGIKIYYHRKKRQENEKKLTEGSTMETLQREIRHLIINEIRIANAVFYVHSRVFPSFKNMHKGGDIVIVGTGPTLNCYIPIKNALHIGVNRAYEYSRIKFDYYFLSHYSNITSEYIDNVRNLKCPKFWGRYLRSNARTWNIPNYIAEESNSFQYYIDNDKFMLNFEEDLIGHPIRNGGSIALHAIQFALWTHPRRIYLVGCDCSMDGYFRRDIPQAVWAGLRDTLRSYGMLKDFAHIYYPDVEIITINPVANGIRGLFRDVYTRSYRKVHEELFKERTDTEYLENLCEIEENIEN